jgi:ectoine hydroxylase-related dioxygenase (phytanoyl-CoA dioxygenase family)
LEQRNSEGKLSQDLYDHLADLIDFGYAIIPSAISARLANQLSKEISAVQRHPEAYIARRTRNAYIHPTKQVCDDSSYRLIDFHVNSKRAHKAIYADKIDRVLQEVFNAPANAFQCLTFTHGSQQSMHQDGAYVVVSEPLQFLASWVALEDVTPGSGELMYFSGSNHLDDFLFPDESKSWNPGKHGKAIHYEFLNSIVARSKAAGMPYETFLPKKGDALIWAADLVHGGTESTNGSTRRSLVTHYCPVDVKPKFSTFTDFFHLRQVATNGYISSRHYDLRPQNAPVKKDHFDTVRLTPLFMGQENEDT